MAYADDDSTQISGRLTASNNQFNLPRGHVDIAVYTSSGKLITETVSGYVPAILTHTMRKKGGVYFSTTFKQLLPPDAIVKFAFHKTQPTVAIKPSHQGNIAQ
jgi:hypothetical protein